MAASDLRIDIYANLLGYARYLAASNPNLSDTVAKYASAFGTTFTYGTGSNQINQVYFERVTADTTQTYNFVSGALTDLVGDSLILSTAKVVILANETAFTLAASGNMILGTSFSMYTGTTGVMGLSANSLFLWTHPGSGMPLSAGVRDAIAINPGGTGRTWVVFVAGVAA